MCTVKNWTSGKRIFVESTVFLCVLRFLVQTNEKRETMWLSTQTNESLGTKKVDKMKWNEGNKGDSVYLNGIKINAVASQTFACFLALFIKNSALFAATTILPKKEEHFKCGVSKNQNYTQTHTLGAAKVMEKNSKRSTFANIHWTHLN